MASSRGRGSLLNREEEEGTGVHPKQKDSHQECCAWQWNPQASHPLQGHSHWDAAVAQKAKERLGDNHSLHW